MLDPLVKKMTVNVPENHPLYYSDGKWSDQENVKPGDPSAGQKEVLRFMQESDFKELAA